MGTPKGTPLTVEVRPETVVVMDGTSRLLARNFVVVDVGTKKAPAWHVVLLVGVEGRTALYGPLQRVKDRAEAIAAAKDYASGRLSVGGSLPAGSALPCRHRAEYGE